MAYALGITCVPTPTPNQLPSEGPVIVMVAPSTPETRTPSVTRDSWTPSMVST
jgi:hypothetical protein